MVPTGKETLALKLVEDVMLAGTSFAVENAVEDVLKAVDIVVATNDKDGVAEACELISTAIRGNATRQPLSK